MVISGASEARPAFRFRMCRRADGYDAPSVLTQARAVTFGAGMSICSVCLELCVSHLWWPLDTNMHDFRSGSIYEATESDQATTRGVQPQTCSEPVAAMLVSGLTIRLSSGPGCNTLIASLMHSGTGEKLACSVSAVPA